MTDRALARRALLESAILKELAEANADTRAQFDLEPGDRVAVEGLGYVQVTKPKPSLLVVDWPAFTRWVETYAPERIITTTTIDPGLISVVTRTGEYVNPDGEVLVPDGVGTVPGTPQLRVSPTDAAHELARGLLGRLPMEVES